MLNFHQILKIFWEIVTYVYEFWLVFSKMGFWTIKNIEINFFGTLYRKYVHKMCTKVHTVLKSYPLVPKLCIRPYVTKI
jgi:hypothetical protein